MKTHLESARISKTDIGHDVSTVLFTVVSTSAVLIGLWAAACMISGVISHGLASFLRGYITAVTGF